VRRGGAGMPFYRVGGERGSRTGRGIRRPVVGCHYRPSGSVGRGNEGGEWGVKMGGSAALFPGEEGTPGRRTLEAAVAAAAFGWLRLREEGSRAEPTWQ
jgi:hypothetical protein